MPTGSRLIHCQGFTYLGVMLLMAILGTTLASTGVVWHTVQQNEREAELLYVGDQFRNAIGHYYNHSPQKEYPQQLADLLRDPRDAEITHHLRKLYFDPITGTQEWGLIKDARDRIIGVYSLSEQHPKKQSHFAPIDAGFENQEKYSDWKFIYQPKLKRGMKRLTLTPQAGTTPVPTPSGSKP